MRDAFVGPNNPGAPDLHEASPAKQLEVNRIALAVEIRNAELRFCFSGSYQNRVPKIFRIRLADSDGSEHAGLVAASGMP
jgi:hypothetical protein